jgi:hypothetical protein
MLVLLLFFAIENLEPFPHLAYKMVRPGRPGAADRAPPLTEPPTSDAGIGFAGFMRYVYQRLSNSGDEAKDGLDVTASGSLVRVGGI